MAIQILPPQKTWADTIASGLGTGLDFLARKKLGELQQRQFKQPNELENLLNSLQQENEPQQMQDQQPELMISQEKEALKPTIEKEPSLKIKKEISAPGAKAQLETKKLKESLKNPSLSAVQKNQLRNEIEKREDRYLKQQDKIDSTTKDFYNKTNSEYKAAQEGDKRLDKMLELVNSGELVGPLRGAALETLKQGIFGIGLDLFGLTGAKTQEFKKIQTDFLRDMKDIFGSRITNQEVSQYLNRIPALTQSDEGKRLVIRDLKSFNEAAKVKKRAMDEIIEENDGFRPHNIEQLAEKRAAPELEKIAKIFKEEYVSPQQLEKEQYARKNPILGLIRDLVGII